MAKTPEGDTQPRGPDDRLEGPTADSQRASNPQHGQTITAVEIESHDTMVSHGAPSTPSPITLPAPVTAPAPAPAEGLVIEGKYELLRLIAEGGMGKVFLARHRELRMPVAVKIMHQHIARNSEHVERFRREALAASRLGHPNIVKVIDFGRLAETFYIVMEYIDGERLGDWLDARPTMPPLSTILPILVQTLDALINAHDAGIVHRDLKPDNILLVKDGLGADRVKIVDFGLARFRDPLEKEITITQPDAVAGTPGYMSPEQCRSLRVTHSTDLYAFGCILTEMLQLDPPFVGESVMDVISKHMFAPIPPLRRPTDAEPISAALERLRRDLLAKAATQRPASARIVRARLLEAFQPGKADDQLVRASEVAQGSREERIPEWNQEGPTPPLPDVLIHGDIEYRRLGTGEAAVEPLCLVGLGSLGFNVHEVAAGEPIEEGRIALIDAGNDAALASRTTSALRAFNPDAKLVVCQLGLTTSIVNALIEAGADDVVRAPTSSDLLGRKLERLGRRR